MTTSELTLPEDATADEPRLIEEAAPMEANPSEYVFELIELVLKLRAVAETGACEWRNYYSNIDELKALPEIAAIYDRLAMLRDIDEAGRRQEATEMAIVPFALLPEEVQRIMKK